MLGQRDSITSKRPHKQREEGDAHSDDDTVKVKHVKIEGRQNYAISVIAALLECSQNPKIQYMGFLSNIFIWDN